MTLAMTTTVLMAMASFTPPSTRRPKTQTITEPRMTDMRLVPLPNMGKKFPSEAKNSVMKERFPRSALSQNPHAELKPIYSPKPVLA